MENKTEYIIEGHPGKWIIKYSWVSELNFIMIAFYNEERKLTMNVNTRTKLDEALQLPYPNKINLN